MAYNVSYRGDSNTPRYFLNGKKFDFSLLSHLKRFNLTDRWNSGIDEGVNEGDKMVSVIFYKCLIRSLQESLSQNK